MDVSKLIRDPSKTHAALKKMSDSCVIAVKPCKIYIPKRYIDKGLAVIGQEYKILGFFALVVDDKYYSVSTTIAMLEIEPSNMNEVTVGEDTYLEFIFETGCRVFKTTSALLDDTLLYRVYNEFTAQGHTPWFISEIDDACMYETAADHAGAFTDTDHAIFEMITSSRARDAKDRAKYWRHGAKKPTDFVTNPAQLIQLRDTTYGASSTVAHYIGPYFKDNLVSTLVTPSTRVENIERLLR